MKTEILGGCCALDEAHKRVLYERQGVAVHSQVLRGVQVCLLKQQAGESTHRYVFLWFGLFACHFKFPTL